jgi:hypothetical protein
MTSDIIAKHRLKESETLRNYRKYDNQVRELYWKKHPNWHLEFKKFADEEFREIKGFYGFYFISNYGQVVSFYFKKPFVRKYNFYSGFFAINLFKFKMAHVYFIHQLVYAAFVGQIKPGARIIHKNGIASDNYYKNLRSGKSTSVKKNAKGFDLSLFDQIEAESNRIPVNQAAVFLFDMQGKFIRKYSSIKKANLNNRLKSGSDISACASGKQKSCMGFQWRYAADDIFRNGIQDIDAVVYAPYTRSSPVLQYDLRGCFLKEYATISEAQKHVNTSMSAISLCASGKYRSAGGYLWRYKNDSAFANGITNIEPYQPWVPQSCVAVYQFDLAGKFIREHPSISAAFLALKSWSGNICSCLQGRIKSSGGFQWRYRSDPLFKNGPVDIDPVDYSAAHKTEPVLQFDIEGRFVNEFRSAMEAARAAGVSANTIYHCMHCPSSTAAGFQWRFKKSLESAGKTWRIEPASRFEINRRNVVLKFSAQGEFICEYPSVTLAANAIGAHPETIRRFLRGETRSGFGYQWRRKSDALFANGIKKMPALAKAVKKASTLPIEVLQFSLSGKFIAKYSSISEAANITNISRRTISKRLRGNNKNSTDYQWFFGKAPSGRAVSCS